MQIPPLGLPILVYLPMLVFIVSVVYSATRFELWKNIRRESLYNAIRLLIFLGGVQLFLFALMLRLDDRIYGALVAALVLWLFFPRGLARLLAGWFRKAPPETAAK